MISFPFIPPSSGRVALVSLRVSIPVGMNGSVRQLRHCFDASLSSMPSRMRCVVCLDASRSCLSGSDRYLPSVSPSFCYDPFCSLLQVSVPLLGQHAGSVAVQGTVLRGHPGDSTPATVVSLWPWSGDTGATPVWLRAVPRAEKGVIVLETAAAELELQVSINCQQIQ